MASSTSTKLKHLLRSLGRALELEQDLWIPYIPFNNQLSENDGLRPRVVVWLTSLNDKFHFTSETLFLTINLYDRFLQRVKAQSKYLKCIAVACLYLAAKTNEEDEVIPSTSELVERSECGCSVAEVLRMELCILTKLDWNVKASNTTYDFLHLLYSLLSSKCSTLLTPGRIDADLSALDQLMKICLPRLDLLRYSPSTIALTVLSLYMELTWIYWLPAMMTLQALVQVNVDQMNECRSLISVYLGPEMSIVISSMHKIAVRPSQQQTSLRNNRNNEPLPMLTLYPEGSSSMAPPTAENALPLTPHPPAKRRKVEQDDDVYDDIRSLYDTGAENVAPGCQSVELSASMSSSCASQMMQRVNGVSILSPPIASR